MTSNYPGAADSFTNPTSSSYLGSPSHSTQHININDSMVAVQTTLGTTAGTSVLKDFAAGQFPARVSASGSISHTLSGGTINNTTLGTPTVTGLSVSSGTINNSVLGTPSITGGTITSFIGTAQITGGTVTGAQIGTNIITGGTATSTVLNSNTVGSPSITGGNWTTGTINNPLIGTPSISGGTVTSLIGTAQITGGTVTGAQLGTNTITGGTVTGAVIGTNSIIGGTANTITVGTPTMTGGTWTTGTVNGASLGTPTIIIGSDAAGDLFYRSAAGTVARLAVGGTGQVLTVSSGTLPAWGAVGTAEAGVTEVVAGGNLTGGTITTTGTIALAGTIQSTMIGTTLFQGGTVAAAVVGTSAITGGTATSTVLNTNTIGSPSITGGTWTTGTINSSALGTPTVTGGAFTSSTFNGGAALTSTSTELNALDGQVDAWTAFEPTPTNFVKGNGTFACSYMTVGKLVNARYKFTLGTTSSVSGAITMTLPVTAAVNDRPYFIAHIVDTGSAEFVGIARQASTTTVDLNVLNVASTYGAHTATGSAVPMTWASTDYFTFYITYEAA